VGENMPPLAAAENIEYFDEKIELKTGDRLFLYTDGVPEGKNPDGERFGTDKMLKILNHRHNVSPKELLDDMMRKVNEFAGESDQFDDVTIMNVIWKGGK
jgi:sigma-B regulation protein RsbU (phosphoserine phosphatase)